MPDNFKGSVEHFQQPTDKNDANNSLNFINAAEVMKERWRQSRKEHYIFFATNFDNPERNHIACKLIQQITGMVCIMGENVDSSRGSAQETIASLIRKVFLVIADVSQDNINTLIEAGIARGANVDYRLIASQTFGFRRKRPPYMFRDKQVYYYSNDARLLGRIHQLAFPFRRRILNYELKV